MPKFHPANSAGKVGVAKKFCKDPTTKALLISYIERFKAGSPTDAALFWISKKAKEIACGFYEEYNQKVSHGSIKRLLNQLGYTYRKQSKQLATGEYAQRELQFSILTQLVLTMSLQSPIISMDCKKKERLGYCYREGKLYCQKPIQVYDHDYAYLSDGLIIPHGIYDLQTNTGYISIGNSAETAHFVTDNLLWWWTQHGIHLYPDASTILLLCDSGGANSYRHHIFKEKLLDLSNQIGISILVCHYPPYASKWNPIEHRLFCHLHQAMSGWVFTDYQTVKERIQATTTQTGLTVVVRLNLEPYQKGLKGNPKIAASKNIQYHPTIPQLNYRILPN